MSGQFVLPVGAGEKAVLALITGYLEYRLVGITAVLFTVIPLLVLQIYVWYRASTTWQRLGVPSPHAWIFFGHSIDYLLKGVHICDMEWTKKYGKAFGSYSFTQPKLILSDQHLLRKVLVKDFHNFTNRGQRPISKKALASRMLTSMRDDVWKNTRSTITPAFTSGKLKGTMHLIENRVNTMCSILDEQTDYVNGVDVKNVMGSMTMDVIAAAAFAMDIDAQRNPNNGFTMNAKQMFSVSFKNWQATVNAVFPWSVKLLNEMFDIRIAATGSMEFFEKNLTNVLASRRQNPMVGKVDFLQLLINAADNENGEDARLDTNGTTPPKKWTLSDRDILAQSFIFLFAGHETTATTLTFACYLLALHPEEQEKCYQEISDLVAEDECLTYDHVQQNLPYTEAVISETLRMYPPATRFDRACENDYQLTDEIMIPKGSAVIVPVYAIHHDPDNYEEPEKFDPERFLLAEEKSKNPFAYLPFGYGPRNCIGMRFAQLEMKLALGNVLKKFIIEPCSKSEPMPIQLDVTILLKPKNPIRLNFKRRQ